ncbi:MAG: polysaccharide deacetylase family protein [Nevskiaceae bacterium]|nr:MAG: polysaccharide deacetylase family protein [Nevskiaceae bacterium]TBR71831.1 MAG: polysaccharide deacetylase family protein [Nevskiaceae bacterium]
MSSTPAYFTHLPPFRELFAQGTPILMYHKLGPRPRHARLRGLYVDAGLFKRQLTELQAAGFRSALPGETPDGASPAVCITFDDGFTNVFHHGLQPLSDHGFHAIEYLVAGQLGGRNQWEIAEGEVAQPLMDKGQVREWLAAGQAIGSHTLTHPWLTRIAPAAAREEISASKRQLEDSFGVAVEHFCYPYGDWNPQVRDLVREAGYKSACTTAFGVNDTHADALALKRILVRYRSRSLRALWLRLRHG